MIVIQRVIVKTHLDGTTLIIHVLYVTENSYIVGIEPEISRRVRVLTTELRWLYFLLQYFK